MAFFYYNGTSHEKKWKDIVNTIQFFQGLQIDNMTQAQTLTLIHADPQELPTPFGYGLLCEEELTYHLNMPSIPVCNKIQK